MDAPFVLHDAPGPIMATAIHAGHDLRPAIAHLVATDDVTRLREEDPYTGLLAEVSGLHVMVNRSRFEVDLNRPRHQAIYIGPSDAWGLDLWKRPPNSVDIEQSLAIYDQFYAAMTAIMDRLAKKGPFLVLDIHSYNHRRNGAQAASGPPEENPDINIGTGSLDQSRWGRLVERFTADLGCQQIGGQPLNVRENIRFWGGHFVAWVHQQYPDNGCALALEFKKTFMDEWTGELDGQHLNKLRDALAATLAELLVELNKLRW